MSKPLLLQSYFRVCHLHFVLFYWLASLILPAGLYMGEIARRIILRLAEEGGLFGRRIPTGLQAQGSLTTPQMSKIDHDTSTDLLRTADVLQEAFGLAVDQITLESTQVVRLTWPCLTIVVKHCHQGCTTYVYFQNAFCCATHYCAQGRSEAGNDAWCVKIMC